MARQKKKAKKRKQPSSSKTRRLFWFICLALIIAGTSYWAGRHFHLIPTPAKISEEEIRLVIIETEKALEDEPAISRFDLTIENTSHPDGERPHLRIELLTDTEIILAEKIIHGLWTDHGFDVRIDYHEHDPRGSVYLRASSEKPLLSASLIQKSGGSAGAVFNPPRVPTASSHNYSRIAIIIDDLGYNLDSARRILNIPFEITISILPYQIYSQDVSAMAVRKGREVILHMPMEPAGYPAVDPGQGALLLSMNSKEIKNTLNQALDSLPHAVGINNHMGSAFTSDPDHMRPVIRVLRSRGLFFVDSRTTKDTSGFILAQEMGVPSAERNVFLDNIREKRAIRHKIIELCNRADEDGEAIGIGHPYPETIAVLEQSLPALAAAGYQIVPASEMVQ